MGRISNEKANAPGNLKGGKDGRQNCSEMNRKLATAVSQKSMDDYCLENSKSAMVNKNRTQRNSLHPQGASRNHVEKRNSSQGSEIVKASLYLNEVAKNTQRRMQSAKAREEVKQSSKKQEDDKHSELL